MTSYKEFISYNKDPNGKIVRVPIKPYVSKFKHIRDDQIVVSSYSTKKGGRVMQLRMRSTSVDPQKKHLMHHIPFHEALRLVDDSPNEDTLFFVTEADRILWDSKVAGYKER